MTLGLMVGGALLLAGCAGASPKDVFVTSAGAPGVYLVECPRGSKDCIETAERVCESRKGRPYIARWYGYTAAILRCES